MRLATQVDLLLRSRDPEPVFARLRIRDLVLLLCLGCFAYGAVMGCYPQKPLQPLYSALKLPILLCGSALVCLPSFVVLNTFLGLRDDLRQALRGILVSQVSLALVLGSLAPFTALCYLSSANYFLAGNCNGAMFCLASVTAQVQLHHFYRPLVSRDPKHRIAWSAWLLLYCFVTIQMAWVLRPFIGDPAYPTTFFRPGIWDNAYVVIWNDLYRLLTR